VKTGIHIAHLKESKRGKENQQFGGGPSERRATLGSQQLREKVKKSGVTHDDPSP
jgi:hypothetical protein